VCELDNHGNTLFSAMLHGASALLSSGATASLEALVKAITYRLVLTPEAIGAYSTAASDGLQHAVDDRILCAEVLRQDDPNEQTSIIGLREWAMGNFFVYLLKGQGISQPLRVTALKLLNCMMKTYSSKVIVSSQKIHNEGGNLASIATFTKLFHSLKECLCNCILSKKLDAMFDLFVCARHCLALPMSSNLRDIAENGTKDAKESTNIGTLLSLACSSSKSNTHLGADSVNISYISEVSKWLNICGKLLRNQLSRTLLFGFITRVDSMNGPESYTLDKAEYEINGIQHLCSSFKSLGDLEKGLFIRKVKATNPYAEKSSNNAAHEGTCLMSHESLIAIEEFITYLTAHSS